jgi:tetratricopeptide (TPR) repeat protein
MEYNRDPEQAIQLALNSLDLARQAGSERYQAISLYILSRSYSYLGKFQEAEHYCWEALELWRILGDPWWIIRTWHFFCLILINQGKIQAAHQIASESVQLYRSQGDQVMEAYSLSAFGNICWLTRQWEEANKAYEENIPHLQDLGDQTIAWEDTSYWSIIKMSLGQYEAARVRAQMSIELANQAQDIKVQGLNYYTLGGVALAQERVDQASFFLEKASALFKHGCFFDEWSWVVGTWCLALSMSGQISRAQSQLLEALLTGLELHSYTSLSYALPAAALLLATTGKVERAVELCGLIDDKALCGKTQWFEDVAGKAIMDMASDLAPEVVEAASKRGKKRDLFVTAAELLEEFKLK